jgi:hypothetical protein
MSRKWFGILALSALATLLLNSSSCGFNQHLTSIQIAPSTGTFGAADPSLFFVFGATGTYIHPPANKDVTAQVTWASDNPQVVAITSAGIASPSGGCGVADITASLEDGSNLVVSNSSAITVDGPASSGCTPAGPQPILTVNFSGTATGTVTSLPSGIDCSSPSTCSAAFTTGATIVLSGTPTGNSSSVTWNGCNSASGESCTVVLENSVTVTATFQ